VLTAVIVATLALSIGATTAVFSVVYQVLWRPLRARTLGAHDEKVAVSERSSSLVPVGAPPLRWPTSRFGLVSRLVTSRFVGVATISFPEDFTPPLHAHAGRTNEHGPAEFAEPFTGVLKGSDAPWRPL
jgi:hypothetical protein